VFSGGCLAGAAGGSIRRDSLMTASVKSSFVCSFGSAVICFAMSDGEVFGPKTASSSVRRRESSSGWW